MDPPQNRENSGTATAEQTPSTSDGRSHRQGGNRPADQAPGGVPEDDVDIDDENDSSSMVAPVATSEAAAPAPVATSEAPAPARDGTVPANGASTANTTLPANQLESTDETLDTPHTAGATGADSAAPGDSAASDTSAVQQSAPADGVPATGGAAMPKASKPRRRALERAASQSTSKFAAGEPADMVPDAISDDYKWYAQQKLSPAYYTYSAVYSKIKGFHIRPSFIVQLITGHEALVAYILKHIQRGNLLFYCVYLDGSQSKQLHLVDIERPLRLASREEVEQCKSEIAEYRRKQQHQPEDPVAQPPTLPVGKKEKAGKKGGKLSNPLHVPSRTGRSRRPKRTLETAPNSEPLELEAEEVSVSLQSPEPMADSESIPEPPLSKRRKSAARVRATAEKPAEKPVQQSDSSGVEAIRASQVERMLSMVLDTQQQQSEQFSRALADLQAKQNSLQHLVEDRLQQAPAQPNSTLGSPAVAPAAPQPMGAPQSSQMTPVGLPMMTMPGAFGSNSTGASGPFVMSTSNGVLAYLPTLAPPQNLPTMCLLPPGYFR